MTRKYSRAEHEAYRREVEAREAREEQERRELAGKGLAYASWVKDGGDPASFEAEWPTLRNELRKRRILADDEASRAEYRATGTSRI